MYRYVFKSILNSLKNIKKKENMINVKLVNNEIKHLVVLSEKAHLFFRQQIIQFGVKASPILTISSQNSIAILLQISGTGR